MKIDKKYLFFLIVFIIWGVFYVDIEDTKNTNKDNHEYSEREVVGDLKDAIKLVVDGNLNIYYFDVGQADSILIENNDKYMLIDAGNNADGKNIVNFLNDLGVSKLDYLIATHAHEDHIGGMDEVINNFSIGKFYMPDVVTTTKTFDDLITSLEKKNIGFNTPNIGDIFVLGGCKFEVLYVGDDEENLNDTSIIVRGLYGNKSFLFMGDASSEVEQKILYSGIDSDVLKVGHHGSRYSTSIKFLKKVTPEYAIISVGEENSYNHPHNVSLTRLKDYAKNIYRTDLDGTIFVSSNGDEIKIDTLDVCLDGR